KQRNAGRQATRAAPPRGERPLLHSTAAAAADFGLAPRQHGRAAYRALARLARAAARTVARKRTPSASTRALWAGEPAPAATAAGRTGAHGALSPPACPRPAFSGATHGERLRL